MTREMWYQIGGFSEEFNPGFGSDPDLNMKMWKNGVRIFKELTNHVFTILAHKLREKIKI